MERIIKIIDGQEVNFLYGMKSSSRSVITYIKGNLSSLQKITIEDTDIVFENTADAIKYFQMPESREKNWSINAVGGAFPYHAFFKSY